MSFFNKLLKSLLSVITINVKQYKGNFLTLPTMHANPATQKCAYIVNFLVGKCLIIMGFNKNHNCLATVYGK